MEKRETAGGGRRITVVGMVVNLALVVVKFMGGIWGHSQALIADAVHSVSDLVTDVIVLIGMYSGRKPPDEHHHFGHGRIETMMAGMVGLALIGTAVYLGVEAALAIYHQTVYHPTELALAGAALSIGAKEALYRFTVATGRRLKSQLIIANAWHHRSDALSSVAVLVGVGVALIDPRWHILDAYASLLVSFLIIRVGLGIMGSSLRELSDAAPRPEILENITRCSLKVPGVKEVHDVRVRISGGLYHAEIHIVVSARATVAEGHRMAKAVEKCLQDDVDDMGMVIVHVDPDDENTGI